MKIYLRTIFYCVLCCTIFIQSLRAQGLTATDFSPKDEAAGVAAGTNLEIVFNKWVSKGKGKITINQNGKKQDIDVKSNDVSVSFGTVTINPDKNLENGPAYITIEEGAFVTWLNDNEKYKGISDETTWNFWVNTTDKTAPAVTAFSPADDAVNVDPGANLVITFNEEVKKGTGKISLNSSKIQEIDVTSPAVTISGKTVTINPPADFEFLDAVNVQMPAGVFVDDGGNAYAGIINGATWNFTVMAAPDKQPPTFTQLSPADNSTNVPVSSNLVITFNEDVKKGTGTITITQGSASQTVNVSAGNVTVAGKTVTIDPASDFPFGEAISVKVPEGAFTDAAGNKFAGITDAAAWNFATSPAEDKTPPTVTSLSPADEAKDVVVNSNLVITFSEAVKKGTGAITIVQGGADQTIDVSSDKVTIANKTVTIDLPSDLPAGRDVAVKIAAGVFTDLNGNPYAGITNNTTWNFTTVSPSNPTPGQPGDGIAPTLTEITPADNQAGVAANTNLVMKFSEAVKKGSGIITLNQTGGKQTLDVSDPAVAVSGTTVTINPPNNFPAGSSVNVQVPAGAFMDAAGNAFAGINNTIGWNFRVAGPDDDTAPLIILSTSFPPLINSTAANETASVKVSQIPINTTAQFVYRGLSRTEWNRAPATADAATNTFSVAMPQSWFDQMGLEYYFEIALPSGVKKLSDRGYTYINYTGAGVSIPGLIFGSEQKDYQIISFPLELKNNSVESILETKLGGNYLRDRNKWRLFTLQNGVMQEYKDGFDKIQPGQGYWLIMKDKHDITTGEGNTLRVLQDSPYLLRLTKGWNQIGNPYNFNLYWPDVKAYPGNAGKPVGDLKVYEGGKFINKKDVLKRFQGAFVFVDQAMDVLLPVVQNKTANARRSQERQNDPEMSLEVLFTVKGHNLTYELGGLGMHAKANPSKDAFDEISLPRFGQYLELNFAHPEYFAPRFTKEVVPVSDQYTWDFTVETNQGTQSAELTWELYQNGAKAGYRMVLFNTQTEQVMDMATQTQHVFRLNERAAFKVLYGSEEYLRENMPITRISLGEPFPNPFSGSVAIPVTLPNPTESYQIRIDIYSLQGKWVATLEKSQAAGGIHSIEWDGRQTNGSRLPAGTYLCRLSVNGKPAGSKASRKIVLR